MKIHLKPTKLIFSAMENTGARKRGAWAASPLPNEITQSLYLETKWTVFDYKNV